MLIDPSSFRDPSGFIFTHENEPYRAVAPSYFENFAMLESSGLYKLLSEKKWLIAHSHVDSSILPNSFSDYKVIKPEKIPFISYPYEWCFSQLKEAAILTLKILKQSLAHGMILKDASAYNIQFIGYKPVFIDTLSFEQYHEAEPWIAYKQFCQHFLAPLALMSYKLPELSGLLKNNIDGIPLNIAASLLPARAMFNSGIASHILLHSKFQQKSSENNSKKNTPVTLSKKNLLALAAHLEDCIEGLVLKEKKSTWSGYEKENSYSEKTKKEKENIIASWLQTIQSKNIWDMGCNTGYYSKIAAKNGGYVLAMDMDFYCIENLFLQLKKNKITRVLPVWNDLSNPSPPIGWLNQERKTIQERGKADTILALALIHHLRIGNNITLPMIASYFSTITDHLIIEFIPKEDSMVKQMLANRKDIFSDYTQENFVATFKRYFLLDDMFILPNSNRSLYRMTTITK